MRHRLGAGQESAKYNPGQFVSATYAARYPHKVAEAPIAEPLPEQVPIFEEQYEEMADYGDEWELTTHYPKD